MVELWSDFWIRETGTGQPVAQLHEKYMMMIVMAIDLHNVACYINLSSYLSSRHWDDAEVAYSSTHTRPRRLRRWVIRATSQALYLRERDPVPVVQVGPRTRSEWLWKVSPPPRFKSQTVLPVTAMQSWSSVVCYRLYKSKQFHVFLWVSLELDLCLLSGVCREDIEWATKQWFCVMINDE